ncbi:MAG: alpha/beta fold hydrolase [bacterium]
MSIDEVTISTSAAKLRALVHGEGPAVLLIHGWLHSADIWLDVLKQMPVDYRVIAIDLPGHGKSNPVENCPVTIDFFSAIVEAAIAECASGKLAALVGDSMGAVIALKLLAGSNNFRETKVLLSGCPFYGLPVFFRFFLFKGIIGYNLRMLKKMGHFSESLIKFWSFLTLKNANSINQVLLQSVRAADPETAARLFRQFVHRTDIDLNQVQCNLPIVVIRGEFDRIISKRNSIRLSRALDSQHLEIPNAGHTPMIENTSEYAAALLALLN